MAGKSGSSCLVDHDPMGHGRGRGALGAAAGRDRDLVVFLPGIVVAEDLVEELDHLRRLPVGRLDLGLVLGIDPVVDRQGAVGVADHDVRRGGQEDEIRRVGEVLGPVIGHRSGRRVLDHADEPAVGGDLEPGFDRGHDLVGDLVVRVVVAGKPVVDVLGEGVRADELGIVGGLGA